MEEISNKDVSATEGLESAASITTPSMGVGAAQLELDRLKAEKLEALQKKKFLMENLPHKYGFKKYKWQREFFECEAQDAFLTAANQIGKSTIMIAQCIEWATNKSLWNRLFKRRTPRQFWYLYPSLDFATSEVETKWLPDLLPQDGLKNDPNYGFTLKYMGKYIHSIHFNSGVIIYFKAYTQDVMNLQGSTVDAIFCFVAGTKISTPSGDRNIEELKVGDEVYTAQGIRKIKRVMNQEKEVITRTFKNGSSLTGTADHPIYTLNRDWVNFGDLTVEDICVTKPPCKSKPIKRSFCSMVSYTFGFLSRKIIGLKTTSEIEEESSCMSPFGNLIIKESSQMGMLSTTSISIRSTILSTIYNFLQEKSTLKYTNGKSGKLEVITSLIASYAVRILNLVVVKNKYLDTVLKNVGRKHTSLEKRTVYNIEVEDTHTYFSNGILVHNCDEELPEDFWDELNFRRVAVKGYFRMAFTATLGQKLWYDTMERVGTLEEKFPTAWKKQVSLYDCKTYEDGTSSHIDDEYIQRAIMMCKSKAEELRRVWGRFASDSGLKYPTFDRSNNSCQPRSVPRNWPIYVGVDIGSGGGEGHPSSIVFVAVSPDYTSAEVFDGWLGESNITTDLDVYEQLMQMIGENGLEDRINGIFYDYHAKDFGTICGRNGLQVEKADKSHDTGEAVLGVLFKTMNLKIQSKACLDTLVFQLSNLKRDTPKKHAVDDFADGLRYAVTRVPFDWEKIGVRLNVKPKAVERLSEEDEILKRRKDQYMKVNHPDSRDQIIDVTTEMDAWGELYDF